MTMRKKRFRQKILFLFICICSVTIFVVLIIDVAKRLIFKVNLAEVAVHRNGPDIPYGNRYISFQTHSYNDLREYHQVFHKNATWLKLDLYYLRFSECKFHKRVKKGIQKKDEKRGCFILSHDTPSSLVGTKEGSLTDYNTTDDLIYMFSNPKKFKLMFRSPITIALCVKFHRKLGNVCGKTNVHGKNFMSLMTDFLDTLLDNIKKNKLKVDLILDGSATPGGYSYSQRKCLANKWRPLNTTFIISKDPKRVLNSDNTKLGYDRMAIFNMRETKEVLINPPNVGKFASRKHYPMLLWEPSDQMNIVLHSLAFFQFAYLDVPLRFSINIDPKRFLLYSAPSRKSNGYAWNENLMEDSENRILEFKVTSVSGSSMFPKNENMSSSQVFVLVYTKKEMSGMLYVRLFEGEENFGHFGEIQTSLNSVTDYKLNFRENEMEHGVGLIFIEMKEDLKNGELLLIVGLSSGTLYTIDLKKLISQKSASSDNILRGKDTVGEEERDMIYSIERLPESDKLLVISKVISGCDVSVDIKGFRSYCLFENLPVSLTFRSSTATRLIDDDYYEILVLYSLENLEKFIHSALLGVDIKSKKISLVHHDLGYVMNVGLNPQLSILKDPSSNKWMVFETHEQGFCYHTHKNNIRADIRLCDHQPYTQSKSLVYNYGDFESFRSHVVKGRRIDVCSKGNIIHGMFDQGTKTTNSLYLCNDDESGKREKICMIEVHRGIAEKSTDSECGHASIFDGLVCDAFTLPRFQ